MFSSLQLKKRDSSSYHCDGVSCRRIFDLMNRQLFLNRGVELVVTVRNEVAKIMFLHLSFSHSVHRGEGEYLGRYPPGPGTPPGQGRYTPRQVHHPPEPGTPRAGTPPGQGRYTPWDQVHPQDQVHPPGRYTPPADGYCCGRYVSYWNAFLY